LFAVYSKDCGDVWPLTLNESGAIQRVYEEYANLVKLLDMKNGCLEFCVSEGCLTAAQAQFIDSQTSDSECNRVAIDMVRRKSLACFRKVVGCLIKAKQSHVAYVLMGDSSEHAFINWLYHRPWSARKIITTAHFWLASLQANRMRPLFVYAMKHCCLCMPSLFDSYPVR
jgi:hypothetical protein